MHTSWPFGVLVLQSVVSSNISAPELLVHSVRLLSFRTDSHHIIMSSVLCTKRQKRTENVLLLHNGVNGLNMWPTVPVISRL